MIAVWPNFCMYSPIGGNMRYNPKDIENYFNLYMENISEYLPEGALQVDIELLEQFNLLNLEKKPETALTRYFNVLESKDKITLINDQFIIWIVPNYSESSPNTFVLIALNQEGVPQLELAFVTSDVYNSSKLVLRILERLLYDIQENEESLKPYEK